MNESESTCAAATGSAITWLEIKVPDSLSVFCLWTCVIEFLGCISINNHFFGELPDKVAVMEFFGFLALALTTGLYLIKKQSKFKLFAMLASTVYLTVVAMIMLLNFSFSDNGSTVVHSGTFVDKYTTQERSGRERSGRISTGTIYHVTFQLEDGTSKKMEVSQAEYEAAGEGSVIGGVSEQRGMLGMPVERGVTPLSERMAWFFLALDLIAVAAICSFGYRNLSVTMTKKVLACLLIAGTGALMYFYPGLLIVHILVLAVSAGATALAVMLAVNYLIEADSREETAYLVGKTRSGSQRHVTYTLTFRLEDGRTFSMDCTRSQYDMSDEGDYITVRVVSGYFGMEVVKSL